MFGSGELVACGRVYLDYASFINATGIERYVKGPVCICDITTSFCVTFIVPESEEKRAIFSVATGKVTEDTLFMLCYALKIWYYSTINVEDAFVMKTSDHGQTPINGKDALVMKISDHVMCLLGSMMTKN